MSRQLEEDLRKVIDPIVGAVPEHNRTDEHDALVTELVSAVSAWIMEPKGITIENCHLIPSEVADVWDEGFELVAKQVLRPIDQQAAKAAYPNPYRGTTTAKEPE